MEGSVGNIKIRLTALYVLSQKNSVPGHQSPMHPCCTYFTVYVTVPRDCKRVKVGRLNLTDVSQAY